MSLNLPMHAEMIRTELMKMINEKYIPNPLKGMVTLEYVLDRYNASIQWITKQNNAVIGNGPYYLEEFNPSGGVVTLNAFRDDSYPFKAGQYSKFENPSELEIQKINVPKFIKIGEPFDFSIEMSVTNSTNELNPFRGNIDFFVTDRNNKLVISDKITINGSRDVSLSRDIGKNHSQDALIRTHLNSTQTSELIPGPSKLKLIITTFDSPKPTIHESTIIARP